MPQTFNASVRIMRSYQYCNFEVNLQSTEPVSLADVDAMRREAARLADKAVEDYKADRHSGETPPQNAAATLSEDRIIDRSYSQEVPSEP
ncbi:hypothetical protein ACXR0O_19040 [Verrucomicrobiota bacterium sgz303538]